MQTGADGLVRERSGSVPSIRVAALAAAVVIADWLFYDRALGLSLALFALTIFGFATAVEGAGRRALVPGLLMVLSSLPVVEFLQPLSIAFLVSGLLVSLVWLRLGPSGLAAGLPDLLAGLPWRGAEDLGSALVDGLQREGAGRAAWQGWAFPVLGGIVLILLLVQANPILAEFLSDLGSQIGAPGALILRMGFWASVGLAVWGLLAWRQRLTGWAFRLPRPTDPAALLGLNGRSVANALVLFNVALGVQTGLDILYLWGGAALPEGLTYAEYAHRGAYPLLATAMLAGGFAIVCRPFVGGYPVLRGLLLLWIAQNVALSVSALLRLDLYVDIYGLTYLRAHAAIWMALVAVGLGLIAWQVLRARRNGWLLVRMAGLGLGTLYLCAFVNFAHVIAAHNLSTQRIHRIDIAYLTGLGPNAAAAIAPYQNRLGTSLAAPQMESWRDWSFREWRVRRYISQMQPTGANP